MSAGWQVLVFGVALVAFVLAALFAPSPRVTRWWPTLVAIGLALVTLVSLWNANAIYE